MAKNKISEFSATPANNTDIGDINIAEGCAPSNINNAIRELMAQLKDQQTGADADPFVVGGGFTCTGAAVFSSTVSIGTPLTVTSGGTGLATLAAGDILYAGGTNTLAKLPTASTTTSVLLSGNTAPTWGKVALASAVSGTLPIVNGGTGQTSASAAINALVPTQGSINAGKYLKTDGTSVSWQDVAAAGVGTVTQVNSGNGMNFTAITGTGAVTMGTPSTLTTSTTNAVTATSHTHSVSFPVTSLKGQSSDTALTGDILLASLESFAKSLNANGYQKFPGGLIVQWGYQAISATTTTITFPTAFSSACYCVNVTSYVNGDTGGAGSATIVKTLPTTTQVAFSTDASHDGLFWIAIGQ